jgi:hypothetical protein
VGESEGNGMGSGWSKIQSSDRGLALGYNIGLLGQDIERIDILRAHSSENKVSLKRHESPHHP